MRAFGTFSPHTAVSKASGSVAAVPAGRQAKTPAKHPASVGIIADITKKIAFV